MGYILAVHGGHNAVTGRQSIIRVNSPIGRLEITASGDRVVGLDIERDGSLPHESTPEKKSAVLTKAAMQ